ARRRAATARDRVPPGAREAARRRCRRRPEGARRAARAESRGRRPRAARGDATRRRSPRGGAVSAAGGRVEPAAPPAFLAALYVAAGLPATDAAACAAQTVDAELRGVASHGCVRTSVFLDRLARGTVNATPGVRVVRELPGYALLDGDRGMSAIGGRRAM